MKVTRLKLLSVLLLSLPLLASGNAQESVGKDWSAWGGSASITFNDSLLNDLNIQLNDKALVYGKSTVRVNALSLGSIEFKAPHGMFHSLSKGSLQYDSQFSLKGPAGALNFTTFRIEPFQRDGLAAIRIIGDQADAVLWADHIHFLLEPDNGELQMLNMDVHLTAEAAAALGHPEFTDLVIAQMHLRSAFTLPANEDLSRKGGLTCDNRPIWPGPEAQADVGLVDMSAVQQVRRDGDLVFVAPSARLKNVGEADIPWYTKFTGPFPPYDNDQHPFLVWSMYQIHEGKFRQIGRSGTKHAFLTINVNCTINCNDSHILWPGCEDVYGVGTNDSNSALGPRDEIEAAAGLWDSCGSFFDPGCTGTQTNFSASTENRLSVTDAELELVDQGAEYYFQAWYVVREDINIFNTMGQRPLNPVRSGNVWNFNPGAFAEGATIDLWVDPANPGAGEANETIDAKQLGSAKVAVKTEDLGGGQHRYYFALNNFDIDIGITEFALDIDGSVNVSNIEFLDMDSNGSNQWTMTRTATQMVFTAPAGEFQRWDSVYNFTFDANAAPVAGTGGVLLNGETNSRAFDTVVPGEPFDADAVFINGFE